jgi:multicomponent K+:H+ antiporter subunit F
VLEIAVRIALVMVTIALILNVVRMARGPSAVDRILALDTLYINAIALLVLLGVARASELYFEAALIVAMMGFVGTVALCKFLLRGDIVE